MKKHNIQWFLNIITLLSFYDLFKNLKDTTLSIQPSLTKPAFTDLNPDDYCYLFVVKLDRYKKVAILLKIYLTIYVIQIKQKM